MKKIFYLFLLILGIGLTSKAHAQTNTFVALSSQSGAPGGTCGGVNFVNLDTATGDVYTCPNGVGTPWVLSAAQNSLFDVEAKTTTYPVTATDFLYCRTIEVSSGTFTITLPATAPINGGCIQVINYGSGVVTVSPNGLTMNGSASSITLAAGSASAATGINVFSDGSNYAAQTYSSTGSNGITGGVLGESLIGTAATTGSSSPAYIDASVLSGSGDAEKIVSCLAALNAINTQAGICDARGLTGGSWDENPFAAAGASIPSGGTLLVPPGNITIKYGPIVPKDYWNIRGIQHHAVISQIGSVLVAGSTYPNSGTGEYSTGTVTVGTAGASDVITGSSTNWTDNVSTAGSGTIAKGCAFLAPSTQPTATNSTFGIISAISSTTSITLAYGQNNGTGAPGGSTYIIYCPVYVAGDGGVSGAAEYNVGLEDLGVDANSEAGVIPLLNWYGQQNTHFNDVEAKNFCGIGFDFENWFYDSGPYFNLIASDSGSCGGASTIPVVVRPNGGMFAGLTMLSVGSSGTAPTIAVDISVGAGILNGLDDEGPTIGVSVNAATSCVPACAMPPGKFGTNNSGTGTEIDNVYQLNGSEAVHLASGHGYIPNVTLRNINGSGATNVLVDDNNSCTITSSGESRLAFYATGPTGGIALSTSSTTGCIPPPPTLVNAGIIYGFCTGTASSSTTLYPFPFNSTGAVACTATAALGSGGMTLPYSCTLHNLYFRAGTAGVSGDTLTIVNNGSNTTIVAALTATSGSDTTHTAAYTAGNSLRVFITSGATETLANLSFSFQCN